MPAPRQYNSHAQRQAAYRKRQTDARIQQMQERGFPPLPAVPTLPGWRRWNTMTQRIPLLLLAMQQEMQEYYEQPRSLAGIRPGRSDERAAASHRRSHRRRRGHRRLTAAAGTE